jgi:translocation and assembly module TamB
LIQFETQGSLVKAGDFALKGESRPDTGQTNLTVSGTKIGAAELGRLIQLPLLLQAGQVDGNLEINVVRDKPLTFSGTATLDKVTARLAQLPQPFLKLMVNSALKAHKSNLKKLPLFLVKFPLLPMAQSILRQILI